MPRCPVCKVQADLIKYEDVPIYNCGSCGGHWMTDARLTVILDRRDLSMPEAVQQKMMEIAEASDSKQTLWCMSCGKEMVKEQFRYWNDIILDRCPKCNGLWLDRGELEKCQIYWEYAKDHPEEWEGRELIEKKALLEAEWALRREETRQQAENARLYAQEMAIGRGGIGMLRALFRL